MAEAGLVEITVQAATDDRPEDTAQEWTQRLELRDGVRISVIQGDRPSRPRRFVVYDGRAVSPQHYAAVSVSDALEQLLRAEGGPMDAWEILMAARKTSSPVASLTMATITRAARLLQRERRIQAGPERGTWMVVGPTPGKTKSGVAAA